jgi:hypothetical protein
MFVRWIRFLADRSFHVYVSSTKHGNACLSCIIHDRFVKFIAYSIGIFDFISLLSSVNTHTRMICARAWCFFFFFTTNLSFIKIRKWHSSLSNYGIDVRTSSNIFDLLFFHSTITCWENRWQHRKKKKTKRLFFSLQKNTSFDMRHGVCIYLNDTEMNTTNFNGLYGVWHGDNCRWIHTWKTCVMSINWSRTKRVQ